MRTNRILAVLAILALAALFSWGLIKAYQPQAQVLQGQIEAREYHVSSKVPGRIEQVLVRKGDQVAVGDLLFSVSSPELDAKLTQAQGGYEAAKALQQEANNGARSQQVMAAKEQWQKAKVAAELASTTYERVENLFTDGVLARQKRDEAYTQWQAAKYTEQAALAMYQMTAEGARPETKVAAAGKALMAKGAVDEVNAVLNDSQMRANHAGEISEVLLFDGELAPSGFPVVSLLDMSDAWAILQVREDLLRHFPMGQILALQVPALDKTLDFKVTYVSPMGQYATWRATESGHDFDMRTFSVELTPIKAEPRLRVGMSVLLPL
ncbi:HlyD family secretion protein [Shewanella sp. NIFS-20-20]|uniref:HlyD family secretion protein n=1 Tax=Shewanella sp. NIFS-20-20 TaxID=2853806 RepID=UPI001C471AFD|nr:efflux RND transporter periplasmic adaptor subunit [Shewanella sp. NIFS-20-20]MBV7315307.1 efflux RND transporter periplasmic adaptor subunit [Shewanella sp. NIFS-20-20]